MKQILLILLIATSLIAGCAPDTTYDDFAKCLSAKDVVMYGSYQCTHCLAFKEKLSDSFQYVGYVECSADGKNAQPQLCTETGVTAYPTFIIGGETDKTNWLVGPSLYELSQKTGCSLPVENNK